MPGDQEPTIINPYFPSQPQKAADSDEVAPPDSRVFEQPGAASADDAVFHPKWWKGAWIALKIVGVAGGVADVAPAGPMTGSTLSQTYAQPEASVDPALDVPAADLDQHLIVPAENTPEKQDEANEIIRKLFDELLHYPLALATAIAEDVVEKRAKTAAGKLLAAIAARFRKQGTERDLHSVVWLANVIDRIATEIDEKPHGAGLSTSEIAKKSGCSPEQVARVFEAAGFTREERWLPPGNQS